jgi:hypothetical protein
MFEEYKHPKNDGLYAFLEAPSELLMTTVPEEARNSMDAHGDLKTISDYLTLSPRISNDKTKCIILLNEKLEPRDNVVSEDDLIFWNTYLIPYGLGSDVWFGLAEYKTKLASPEYAQEDI